MSLRRTMLPNIISMIDKTEADDIVLKTTSKIIILTSPDNQYGFGFRKSTNEMPRLPITLKEPEVDAFNADRALLIKKLNRLGIAFGPDIGVKTSIGADSLNMETLTERKSTESMACKRTRGAAKLEFIIQHRMLKTILNLFQASNIDVYVEKAKCTMRSKADLEITGDNNQTVSKSFLAVALISLARAV
jgi:hypothetical protein